MSSFTTCTSKQFFTVVLDLQTLPKNGQPVSKRVEALRAWARGQQEANGRQVRYQLAFDGRSMTVSEDCKPWSASWTSELLNRFWRMAARARTDA